MMKKNRLRLFAAILALTLAMLSSSCTLQWQDGNIIVYYPAYVNGFPGSFTNFQIGVQAKTPLYDVSALSCSINGGNVNLGPQFLGLTQGTTNYFTGTLSYPGQGINVVNCSVIYGQTGGADLGPFPFTFTYSTIPPTVDSTNSDRAADPISTATGELYTPARRALSLGGPISGGFNFELNYASLRLANGIATRIGNNWMHSFEWLLTLNGTEATVTRVGGRPIVFNKSGNSWTLAYPEQYGYQLVSGTNGSYLFLDPRTNLIYTFSGTGTTLGNTSIQDRNGNTLTIALPSNGTSQVSDGLGRSLTLTYDSNGNLIKVADQTGRSVSFAYAGGNLTQFTDANGKTENYAYTTAGVEVGLLTASTLPLGNKPLSQTWDQFGRVATQTDSRGNKATMTYDKPVGSSAYQDALGNVMTDTSQNYSDFLTYTDPDKQTLRVTYDANGHRNTVTDRLGNKIAATFDPASGYLASVTDAAGNTTTNTWLAQVSAQVSGGLTFYVLAKVQYADGTSVSYTYDSSGNRLTATNQAGKIWKYTYNSRGQILTETDPDGYVQTYAYNAADGTLASQTDAAGGVTNYSYDAQKRVNLVTYADGSTESTTYDNVDHVVKTVQGNGNATTFTYNSNEKLQSTAHGPNPASTVSYDTDEHTIKTTDSLGQSTSYTYNALGLNDSLTSPAGETFRFTYDSHHRHSALLDPSGNGWTLAYDNEDGPISITDALSRKISFGLDKIGSLVKVTTPLGESYTYTRDKRTRVTAITDPSGLTFGATLDSRGLPTASSTGNLTATYKHDDAGLLTGVIDPNGGTWGFGYDTGGRLATRTDPLQRATMLSYDKRNRLSGVRLPLGTVSFTRDGAGNVSQESYSDGTLLNYSYGPGNRLTTGPGMTLTYDSENRITGSNGLVVTRDADGRIGSITYAAGKTVTYTYNAVGLLASVTDWVSGTTTFTYDAAQELTLIKRPNGLGTQYTYDLDGRVASIQEDAGSAIVLQRDAAGKTVSATRTQPQAPALAPGLLPLSFDAADQVSGFTYDAMGRVTGDTWRTYTWDLASRLKSYAGVGGTATAVYDGTDLRISETTAAGVLNYVWNYSTGLATVATVQDGSGDRRYYVYTPAGALLYGIDAADNARHFYHFDENGSTVLLTNDAGAVTDSYGITPYGETVTQNGVTENPFTWLGQWGVMQEGSTGLYYMRARYYDSATGRFLSPDPEAGTDPQSVNPYQYALGNPNAFADPTGLGVGYVRVASLYGPCYRPGAQKLMSGRLVVTKRRKPVEILWGSPGVICQPWDALGRGTGWSAETRGTEVMRQARVDTGFVQFAGITDGAGSALAGPGPLPWTPITLPAGVQLTTPTQLSVEPFDPRFAFTGTRQRADSFDDKLDRGEVWGAILQWLDKGRP
jgi:RHS repeat-associated protein